METQTSTLVWDVGNKMMCCYVNILKPCTWTNIPAVPIAFDLYPEVWPSARVWVWLIPLRFLGGSLVPSVPCCILRGEPSRI